MSLSHKYSVSEGAKLHLAQSTDMIPVPEPVSSSADALRQGSEGNWYALYTCPRHEKRLAEQMERRSISCFLPLYRSVRRWKDRRKELALALFPGYVFVRIALENRLRVLELPGAVRLVSVNGKPVALSAKEIEALQVRMASADGIEPHPYLREGRRVRVRSGVMQGLEGIIVRRKDRCRVVFSIDLIMRSVAIEVDEADLESV
jgi:transcription antitermination factor NusG